MLVVVTRLVVVTELIVVSGGVVVPARIDDIKASVCVYGLCKKYIMYNQEFI